MESDAITVADRAHWEAWIVQNDLVAGLNARVDSAGLFDVSDEGLQPVLFRRRFNAALEAAQHSYSDAVRYAGAEVRGGAAALSNPDLAVRAIDGDLETWWEPETPPDYLARRDDPGDFSPTGLGRWELLVDLGRLVFADSVEVIFPDGDRAGDPPRSFSLLASMGEQVAAEPHVRFTLVEQLRGADLEPHAGRPGYVRALFRLEPLDNADFDRDGLPDLDGAFVQYVKLKITDTTLWRRRRLGSDEAGLAAYEALPRARRGAVVFQRVTAGGVLVELEDREGGPAARQLYETLPEDRRGPTVYYAKELPRVAEIRVWVRGDNYALRPARRGGGGFEDGGLGDPLRAMDGIYETQWLANTWSPFDARGTGWFDLGAVYWVDTVTLAVKPASPGRGTFLGHDLRISDGTIVQPLRLEHIDDFPKLEASLRWDDIISSEHFDNEDASVSIFSEHFDLRPVRFLQMRHVDPLSTRIVGLDRGGGEWFGVRVFGAQLAELQLYGEGYPAGTWIYSPPIALVDERGEFARRALTRIDWQGRAVVRRADQTVGLESLLQHPEVQLQVQTRTSDRADTSYTYFERYGEGASAHLQQITAEAYEELRLRWAVWKRWEELAVEHQSDFDDDGDGAFDEDPINLADDDGDGLVDEDGPRLGRGRRPRSVPVRDGELAFDDWSSWSHSYASGGALISSPSPRRFLQIRVNIRSREPFKTARIERLRVTLDAPLALALAAELALLDAAPVAVGGLTASPADYRPPTAIDPLTRQTYSYFVRASPPDPDEPHRSGFDELLVVAPRAARLLGVRWGQVEATPGQLRQARATNTTFERAFAEGPDGRFLDATGMQLQVLPTGADSVHVRFPFAANGGLSPGRHALIEVQLQSQLLRQGVEFAGFVRDSHTRVSGFQRISADLADATELVDSGTVRVELVNRAGLVHDLEWTRAFTPNDDGVNDEFHLRFTLLKVLQDRPVAVRFHDLAGRAVGQARQRDGLGVARTGVLEFFWDGRDDSGRLVAPGIYLCRLSVGADRGAQTSVRAVRVAY